MVKGPAISTRKSQPLHRLPSPPGEDDDPDGGQHEGGEEEEEDPLQSPEARRRPQVVEDASSDCVYNDRKDHAATRKPVVTTIART